MRKIIALSGAKGSGKTTAFNMIKENNPYITEITFAGKIKDVCSRVFDIPLEHFNDQSIKEVPFTQPIELTAHDVLEVIKAYNLSISIGKLLEYSGTPIRSPRHMAQFIGTELLRSLDQDVHVNAALANIREDGVYVVTDMRFDSEFKALYDIGAEMYHIDNDVAEEASKDDKHPSELQRHSFKIYCNRLDNNGTLDEFRDIITQEVL